MWRAYDFEKNLIIIYDLFLLVVILIIEKSNLLRVIGDKNM
jgi:hypothetical protein